MDFGAGGEGIYEELEVIRGKLPFSSNSSSSSSHHYPGLVPLSSEAHLQRAWLGNQYQFQQDTSRRYDGPAPASSLELMEMSPRHEHEDVEGIQREHMFDKVVTPSDVGKLNRLVIPKQHAEKYFPLDSSTNDKGLLLNFEDRSGKPWRFRYSYWNSSQSYVMTKGWSRFVKEKKLDAGDIVSFQRGVGESGKDRLYIDWRRRPNVAETPSLPHHFPYHHRSVPWSPLFLRPPLVPQQDDNSINFQLHRSSYNVANPVYYLRSAAAPQVQQREPMVFESVPVVHGKAAAKRLRLFGVNMECPISEPEECEILSSTSIPNVTMATSLDQYQYSSSAHAQPPLPFRLYNGTPLPAEFVSKGKQASMSLDLDI